MNRKPEARGNRILTVFAGLAVAALFVSLVPLLWTALYAHPAYDDFNYGLFVHQAVQAGGGWLDVFAAAARRVGIAYQNWQGTFSAVFLFALMPGAFSEELYCLTGFIMIGSLLLGTFVFFDALIVRWLDGRRAWSVLLSSCVLFLQIQFVPYMQQTFYWYNGSCYYTLFYAISLLFAALVVRILTDGGRLRPLRLILGILLAAFIGGGNYSTALLCAELLVLTTLRLIREKHPAWRQLLALTLALLVSLLMSMVAPGNAVRANSGVVRMSPLSAILHSVVRMMQLVGDWTRLPQMVLLAFAAPFLYFLSERCGWSFRWPVPVCALAFLLCASQLTPPYYAMSGQGGTRQVDIYYYCYYFMLLFCEFYLCGWFERRGIIRSGRARALCRRQLVPACVLLAALMAMGCGKQIKQMNSTQVAVSLLCGEPQRYDQDFRAWRDELIAAEGDYAIHNLKAPSYFHGSSLREDPGFSCNRYTAKYYGLDSITALSGEND